MPNVKNQIPSDRAESTGAVLVLCGLPASGKTWLAKHLEETLTGQKDGTGDVCHVYRVSYDLLLPPQLEVQLIYQQQASWSHAAWKQFREQIIQCVDCLLRKLTLNLTIRTAPEPKLSSSTQVVQKCNPNEEPLTRNQFDLKSEVLESFTLSQDSLLFSTPHKLEWSRFCEHVKCNQTVSSETSEATKWLLIVDDNMYYRSMRYQYFQLARKYSLGFCQVFKSCSTEMALQQNSLRSEHKVPDDVIITMASKIEKPLPALYSWEKFSIILDGTSERDIAEITALLEEAWRSPLTPVAQDNAEQREESRRACSASLLHQVDQILRKIISAEMKVGKGKKVRNDLQQYSKALSQIKSDILSEFREGQIRMDCLEDEIDDASKHGDSRLFEHVQQLFRLKLNLLTEQQHQMFSK